MKVRPRRVARQASVNGRPVSFYGFGCYSLSPLRFSGVRRKGTGFGTLKASGILEIVKGNGSCDGDSGGPVVLDDENELVIGVLSEAGQGAQPIAWSVTADATAEWFKGLASEVCFEDTTGGPCDITVRHTSNSHASGAGVHGPIAHSGGAKMMPLRE